ncbi:MAG: nickel-responsive transcriptional regulator NikR [candidate division WOR-3 bacterium]
MVRFSISMDEESAAQLDELVKERGYANRSEAVRDMVRKALLEERWEKGGEVLGVLITVFDHTKRLIQERITEGYHKHHEAVITTLHLHLDDRNCMEVSAITGEAGAVKGVAKDILRRPGLIFGKLVPVARPEGSKLSKAKHNH